LTRRTRFLNRQRIGDALSHPHHSRYQEADSGTAWVKAIARKRIAGLAENPIPTESRELEGHAGHFRLWLGAKYRLVWQVDEEQKLVEIEYVGPKAPDLYDKLNLKRPN
jgi:mRNA-degrading endonuclease RelE of RelBE toxin-antitoxin system